MAKVDVRNRRRRRLGSLLGDGARGVVEHNRHRRGTAIGKLLVGLYEIRKQLHEYYAVITRESERLTRLIDNVLDFSRIEGGRQHYDMVPGSVEPIVHDVVEAFRYPLAQQGFKVDVEIAPDLPDVLLDAPAMKQALANLVDNAIKYSGEHRRLRVSARRAGDDVLVEVADTVRSPLAVIWAPPRMSTVASESTRSASSGLAPADGPTRASAASVIALAVIDPPSTSGYSTDAFTSPPHVREPISGPTPS